MKTHDVGNVSADQQEPRNLVEVVTGMLTAAGHPDPAAWQTGIHPDVFSTEDVNIQRFLINRHIRLLLAGVQENTMDVRYCLVDTGAIKDWMRLFESEVVPCLVRNQLPTRS